MRRFLVYFLFLVALAGSALAALPSKIVMTQDVITFENESFSGQVDITFTAPGQRITFVGLTGDGNFTVNGSGKIVFKNASLTPKGTFLTYYGDRGFGEPLSLSFIGVSLTNGSGLAPVVSNHGGPINIFVQNSHILLSVDGALRGSLNIENSHVRLTGSVRYPTSFTILDSYVEGTFTDSGLLGSILSASEGEVRNSSIYWAGTLQAENITINNTNITSTGVGIGQYGVVEGSYFDYKTPLTVGGAVSGPTAAIHLAHGPDVSAVLELRDSVISGYPRGIITLDASGCKYFYINVANTKFEIPPDGRGVDACGRYQIAEATFEGTLKGSPSGVGINYYDSSGSITDSTFKNLDIGISAYQTISLCYGFSPVRCLTTTSNMSICNNTITNTTLAINLFESQLGEICNNTINGSGAGIVLWDPIELRVENNRIEGGQIGVALASKDGQGTVTFHSNVFKDLEVAYGPTVVYKDGAPAVYTSAENTFDGVTNIVKIFYTTTAPSPSGGGGPSPVGPIKPVSPSPAPEPVSGTQQNATTPANASNLSAVGSTPPVGGGGSSTPSTPAVATPTSPGSTQPPLATASSSGSRPSPFGPPMGSSPMERVLGILTAMGGSNTALVYSHSIPLTTTHKEMVLSNDAIYLPDIVALANDTSNGSFKLIVRDTLVYGDKSGILFKDGAFDARKLADLIREATDTGSIYLGDGIISIDTTAEPALAGVNATLYFKVPSCSYLFRIWFADTFTTSPDDVKALGRTLTTPTQCTYDERMKSYVLKVPITIE